MGEVPVGEADKLGIDIDLIYEPIPLPRNRDTYIMEIFVELGIQGEQLEKTNKRRKR